jgi:hypothetical protein
VLHVKLNISRNEEAAEPAAFLLNAVCMVRLLASDDSHASRVRLLAPLSTLTADNFDPDDPISRIG